MAINWFISNEVKKVEKVVKANTSPQDDFSHEREKIKQALGEVVYHHLGACNAVLAGGALTSIFSGAEINDFDIYWKDKEGFSEFIIGLYGVNPALDLSIYDLRVNHYTTRSILLETGHKNHVGEGAYVQLIGMKVFPSTQDIFDSFDFTINMATFDFRTEEFVFHKNFLKDIAQRRISVNEKTSYPFISVLRVDKYKERGYHISKAQMMKLLLAVNSKQMDSWDKLKEELGGLYGLNPDEVVDDTKEFSLQEAMNQLSKLFVPKEYKNIMVTPSIREITKDFGHMLTEEASKFVNTATWKKEWNSNYDFGE